MSILIKGISDSDTVLMFTTDPVFPEDNGVIKIESEIITYTSNYMGTLYGCTRGAQSTTPVAHLAGVAVSLTDFFSAPSGGGGGASTSLSNLTTTAINAQLKPDTNDTYDLGDPTAQWKDVWSAEGLHINGGNILHTDADGFSFNGAISGTGELDLLAEFGSPQSVAIGDAIGFAVSHTNQGSFDIVADPLGNVILGPTAIAAADNDGFVYIPTVNDTPTGAPTNPHAALVYDTLNQKLWIYSGGTWRSAAFI